MTGNLKVCVFCATPHWEKEEHVCPAILAECLIILKEVVNMQSQEFQPEIIDSAKRILTLFSEQKG